MKRPAVPTLLLGHPVVAVPLILGGLALLWACWQRGSEGVITGIVTLICLARVITASEQVSHFRAWKRAWEGMGEAHPTSSRWRWAGGVACLGLLAIYGAKQLPPDQLRVAIAVLAIMLALVMLWAGIRWARRRMPRGRRRDCVSVAARTPLMRAPKLQAAYRALPPYCEHVLDARQL